MRLALLRGLLAAIFLGIAGAAFVCPAADGPQAQPAAIEQAKALVHDALQAEAHGQPDQRITLLREAREVAPDFAPARWHSGDVQLEGKWVAFDAPSKDSQGTAKMEEYRQRRDQAGNKYDDQMELARWCEKAGLKEEQRVHLIAALQLQPRSAEARNKLGVVFHNGQWMPPAQVEESDTQLKGQQQDYLKWKDRLVKLRGQLDIKETESQALQELRDIDETAPLPLVEKIFGRCKSEVGKAVVEALAKMRNQPATESLVRFAAYSPYEDVRYAAAKALKSRSLYASVPLLLSGLKTPTTVRVNRFQEPNGRLSYEMSLYKEGPTVDRMYTSVGLADPWGIQWNYNAPITRRSQFTPIRDPVAAVKEVSKAADHAEQRANQILAANDEIAAENERIISVLRTVTNEELSYDVMDWYGWWSDYNGYAPINRPTQYNSDFTYRAGLTFNQQSCFPAGTAVWTITGPVQIDLIKPSDLVLSQSAETGELAYKPVVKTTVRSPTSLVKIQMGDTQFRCTPGHPLWVSGAGWKMAKELKAGDWLHTVKRPVLIDSVGNEKDEATCYNMVVADFDSYFVGEAKVLAHDNNLRQATDAVVPGLIQP